MELLKKAMTEDIRTISQHVSNFQDNKISKSRAQRIPQYAAGLSCQLGALTAGLVLGWTFLCGPEGKTLSEEYNLPISSEEFSWVGSSATLGAASICLPIGMISDLIGRKRTLLITVIPITIGWALIIWASSVYMICVGRYLTGFSIGVFCLVGPLYTSEICENEIRGRLGSYYEFFLTSGILTSYILGTTLQDIYSISLVSAVVPLFFCCIFTFMPETPTYYLKKGKEDAAVSVLVKLRGLDYDVKSELQERKNYLEYLKKNYKSYFSSLQSKSTRKGLLIIYGLMFFQQMSGVNAFVFYSTQIFSDANVNPNIGTIVFGVIMVISVFISTLCIDKWGRRPLLMISIGIMCLMLIILGISFYLLKHQGVYLLWVPVVTLCIYTCATEIGMGPVPFVMIGEIIEPRLQGTVGSTACCLNWLLAFVVTRFFSNLTLNLGDDFTIWIFSAVCGIGFLFIYFIVIETKNKSLQTIQMEMDVHWI